MSFYTSGNLKTEIIDPVYYNENDRVEFRLDKGTIMNNLKLINLGVNGAGTPVYSPDAGVVSLIKNIHLYDGKVTLQSQFGANSRYAFTQLQADNKYNSNIDRFLKRHEQGYSVVPSLASTFGKKVVSLYTDVLPTIPATDSGGNSSKGAVSIMELLPILKVLPVLPSSVFKQLRLVIEFEADINKLVSKTDSAVTTIKPSLVVDRFVNEQAEQSEISKLSNSIFMNYEKTQINIPASTAQTETHKKVATFNNKLLNRLRLQYNFADSSKYVVSDVVKFRGIVGTSINCDNRTVQYRVNGENVLPRSSLKGDMRRLAMNNDVYGTLNMTPEMATSMITTGARGGFIGLDNDFHGVKDFDSVYIGKMVDDLQISITRNNITDTSDPSFYKDALTCIVEGEITKQINFGNGGYNIGYVSI